MGTMKEKILMVSLELFAVSGYNTVTVSDISAKLNITKGALYKHYRNKRDIFDSIIERMKQNDGERSALFNVPEKEYKRSVSDYEKTTLEELKKFSLAQFDYWTKEKFSSEFRKFISLERYKNQECAELYKMFISSGPLDYVKDILLNKYGKDAEQKALEFYAPIYLSYELYDFSSEKEIIYNNIKNYIEKFDFNKE